MNATLHTNHGYIEIVLFPDHAPKTVDGCVGLAKGTKDYAEVDAFKQMLSNAGVAVSEARQGVELSPHPYFDADLLEALE